MQTIYLDISNKGITPCIYAKQNEVGRKFLAVITDNGMPYEIPSNSLLSVWYEGDTDAGNYSSIEEKSAFSIDGNKVAVELVAQMLLNPGKGELCLSITHGDGGETNTWNIPYCVEYKPGAGSSVPTEYYTALTEAGSVAAENAAIAKTNAEIARSYGSNILLSVYPVGSIYISAMSTDPANLFGGTWHRIEDRFILASGSKFVPSSIGGSETQKLTVDELPNHGHYISEAVYGYEGWTDTIPSRALGHEYNDAHSTTGREDASYIGGFTSYVGGGKEFSIMPPYVAVYVWQRIS